MKVYIHLSLGWDIFKVDCCIMFILWFAQVKGKLIVYGKIVVTTLIHGVAKIVVLCVTLFTMVPSDPLGGAKTIATPVVT